MRVCVCVWWGEKKGGKEGGERGRGRELTNARC